MYFSNSQPSRDLPSPGSPTSTSRPGCRISSTPWKSSFSSRSSRSRPTSGASRPSARWAPPTDGDHRVDRPQRDRVDLALEVVGAHVEVGDRRRRSAAGWSRRPRPAPARPTDCTRAAVFTASPATMPWLLGADGDRHLAGDDPDAHGELGTPRSCPIAATAAASSSPARTARSASSSWEVGTPQTAITASPMNFSTVPPYRPMTCRHSSK